MSEVLTRDTAQGDPTDIHRRAGHVSTNRHLSIKTRTKLTPKEQRLLRAALDVGMPLEVNYVLINKGQTGTHKVQLWGYSPADVLAKARKFYAPDSACWDHSEIVPAFITLAEGK